MNCTSSKANYGDRRRERSLHSMGSRTNGRPTMVHLWITAALLCTPTRVPNSIGTALIQQQMASNDSKQAPAATYMPSARTNPGLIHLTPHGLTIPGDVLVTFVCVEGERRNTQKSKKTS